MTQINIYSTRNINIISIIISLIILLIINIFSIKFDIPNNSKTQQEQIIAETTIEKNEIKKEEAIEEKLDWYIEIPSIMLKAPIKETTESQVLNKYVGHFEETSLQEGNIGLAAHNRGYEKNYFSKINLLKKGEKIKYKYYDFEKSYKIETIKIIKDTDWTYLENTQKNCITLITCVENKPQKRLCIQAIEE